MRNPKISIVTISYNSATEIEDTILSVINQKYNNKEYIIIDGASKDGTMQIVNKYRNNIDVIVSEPDKGRSDAFNKGIAKATGDYIVMINAGDLLADNALDKFAKAFKSGYDIIKGNTIRWNPDTNYTSIEKPVVHYPTIPFNFYVCHQSSYISRDAYTRFGNYKINMRIAMDFELMLRFERLGARFYVIDEDLAIFRMGGISQTSSNKRIEEMKYAMKSNGRSSLSVSIFSIYLQFRTMARNLLDLINPDLKSRFVTNKKDSK